jgi:serine/threonine-protein kinase ATR
MRRLFTSLLLATCLPVGLLLHADDQPKPAPLMRDFMGINGHFAFKPALYRPTCNLVRNYHSTVWDLGEDTAQPPTFPLARNKVDWSTVYGSWKKEGFQIDACLQFESIKPTAWKNLEADAHAYGESFAKYFGPSSSNLVTSAEIGNEPASYDVATYRKVFENIARGLRDGDPKLKIVTCAANAGKPDQYSKPTSVFDGLEDLYDVLNIHTYSFIEGWPTWRRVNPEHEGIAYLKVVTDMLKYRDAHAPGKEVWITEFGYDAGTGKTGTGDFARWVSSTETEKAQWIVRSFLVFSSMGVDRAYVYYFDDKDDPMLHGASGLTRNFIPKPAYYAMAHLYKTLGDYRFSRIVPESQDTTKALTRPYVFEYVNPDKPKKPIWVVWSPTGTQKEFSGKITVPGQIAKAERMPLKAGDAESVSLVTDANGNVSVPVTESPLYIWLKL